jgi:hypothetical protein
MIMEYATYHRDSGLHDLMLVIIKTINLLWYIIEGHSLLSHNILMLAHHCWRYSYIKIILSATFKQYISMIISPAVELVTLVLAALLVTWPEEDTRPNEEGVTELTP